MTILKLVISLSLSCTGIVCALAQDSAEFSSLEDLVVHVQENPNKIDMLKDARFLDNAFGLSEVVNTSIFLDAFSGVSSIEEFAVRKVIWGTIVVNWPKSARSSIVENFVGGGELNVDALVEIAVFTDFRKKAEFDEYSWDFSGYEELLVPEQWNSYLPLFGYFFKNSPSESLKLISNFGYDGLGEEFFLQRIREIEDLSDLLESYKRTGENRDIFPKIHEFAAEVISIDKWYFDAFIAGFLEKARLRNISPEFNSYLENKDHGLAHWIKEGEPLSTLTGSTDLDVSYIIAGSSNEELNLRPDDFVRLQEMTTASSSQRDIDSFAHENETSRPSFVAYYVLGFLVLGSFVLFLVLRR